MVPGTGILLNNEMDDFSAKPGNPNHYSLLGGACNAIEPGKRMLSSMTPTILLRETRPFLIAGSPSGSHIISTVLQIVVNVVDHGMNIAEATETVRIHHQWFPDELRVERGLSEDTVRLLRQRGHNVIYDKAMGGTETILYSDGIFQGSTDPRRPGGLAAGF